MDYHGMDWIVHTRFDRNVHKTRIWENKTMKLDLCHLLKEDRLPYVAFSDKSVVHTNIIIGSGQMIVFQNNYTLYKKVNVHSVFQPYFCIKPHSEWMITPKDEIVVFMQLSERK